MVPFNSANSAATSRGVNTTGKRLAAFASTTSFSQGKSIFNTSLYKNSKAAFACPSVDAATFRSANRRINPRYE